MKLNRILFILLVSFSKSMIAQDIIVKKDGTPILVKVLEVNPNHVKYVKYDKPNDRTYTINIAEILSLTYADGDKEDFSNTSQKSGEANLTTEGSSSNDNNQRFVELPPDDNNAGIIKEYNKIYQPTKKIGHSNENATRCFILCGVKDNSLMSNSEIEMKFVARSVHDKEMGCNTAVWDARRYLLMLTNKTDKTIYIDKGNCFRISPDGSSYTYFEPSEQITATQGGEIGASMNMGAVTGALGIGGIAGTLAGGLNVGRSSNSSTSITYNQQRILAIPPYSFRYLTEDKYVQIRKEGSFNVAKYKTVEKSERFLFMSLSPEMIGISKNNLHNGEVLTFAENDLPWSRKYIITYSTSETFRTYSSLNCEMFIKEIIGSRKPRNINSEKHRHTYGEDFLLYDNWSKYISQIDPYCIVGFSMFDGEYRGSGTGVVIGGDH